MVASASRHSWNAVTSYNCHSNTCHSVCSLTMQRRVFKFRIHNLVNIRNTISYPYLFWAFLTLDTHQSLRYVVIEPRESLLWGDVTMRIQLLVQTFFSPM